MRTKLNVLMAGAFTRGATAYQHSGSGQTSALANVRRTATVLSCSSSDGATAAAELGADGHAIVQCVAGGYLYAIASLDTTKLYRSDDGTTWWGMTPTGTDAGRFKFIAATSTGRLCAWLDVSGTTYAYYSDDGLAWARATHLGAASFASHPERGWNFVEGNGVLIASTYGTTTTPEIWRSDDDGMTWTRVLQMPANMVTHFHAIAYHAGTGKWIADTGDGVGKRMSLISSDNGVTWLDWKTGLAPMMVTGATWTEATKTLSKAGAFTQYASMVGKYLCVVSGTGVTANTYAVIAEATADALVLETSIGAGADGQSNIVCHWMTPSIAGQTTQFVDYGHPTRLLVGSDAGIRVGWLDLSTNTCGTMMPWQPAYAEEAVVFTLHQHSGLWYASFHRGAAGNHTATIMVSPDLSNWTVYHRCIDTANYSLMRYAGFIGGKLHYILWTNDAPGQVMQHFSISPARVQSLSGVVIQPQATNLQTAASSKGEDTSFGGYWQNLTAPIGTLTGVADVTYAGTLSTHYVKQALPNTTGVVSPRYGTAVIGRWYVAGAVIRGKAREVEIFGAGSSTIGAKRGLLPDNQWTMIFSRPFQATAVNQRIILTFTASDPYAANGVDVHIGGLMLFDAPGPYGEWSLGQATQAADVLSLAVTPGTDWTHVFSAYLYPSSDELITSEQYLCTYKLDANDYVEVYYDPADSKFKLRSTDNGVAGTPVATAARWLHRGHCVRVAVRYSAGALRLSVSDGNTVEHVPVVARARADLEGTEIAIQTGDNAGANVIPHVLTEENYLYAMYFSDAQVNEMMSLDVGAYQRQALTGFGPYELSADGRRLGPWDIDWDRVGPYESQ